MEPTTRPWRVFDEPAGVGPSTASGGATTPPTVARPLGVQPVVLIAVVAAFVIGAAAVAIVLMDPAGSATVDGPDVAVGGSPVTSEFVTVDVSGAVAKPGLYRLERGSRIGDAIALAGGLTPRVAADRMEREVNLAATLTDGQRVHVPSRDEDDAAAASPSGGGSRSLVDLNHASQAELEALPGIGPATATKIIESRTGAPFHAVDDLRDRGLVGQKTFDKLRPLVTVS